MVREGGLSGRQLTAQRRESRAACVGHPLAAPRPGARLQEGRVLRGLCCAGPCSFRRSQLLTR